MRGRLHSIRTDERFCFRSFPLPCGRVMRLDRLRDGGDSRKFKLSPVAQISSTEKPTMDGRRSPGSSDRRKTSQRRLAVHLDGLVQNQPCVCFRFGRGEENWHRPHLFSALGPGRRVGRNKGRGESRRRSALLILTNTRASWPTEEKGLGRKLICGPSRPGISG